MSSRAASTAHRRKRPILDKLRAMFHKRLLPFELWLGRGQPLNPYLIGLLCEVSRRELAPVELKMYPEELMSSDLQAMITELHCLRLSDFFDAPNVQRDWKVKSTDNELVRFGLKWRIYDLVEKLGPDPQDGNLGTRQVYLPLYLFGGTAGNSFLVFAEGLVQPSARRGSIRLDFYPTIGTLTTISHKACLPASNVPVIRVRGTTRQRGVFVTGKSRALIWNIFFLPPDIHLKEYLQPPKGDQHCYPCWLTDCRERRKLRLHVRFW